MGKEKRIKVGISEIIGEAQMPSGDVQSAYRALRQLLCARCGKVIAVGDVFTRRTLPDFPIPISPRCNVCDPFELRLFEESKENKTKSALLRSLLDDETQDKNTSRKTNDEELEEKFKSRLGPALDRVRRKRRDDR
jgi:hypothetical protein